MDKVLMSYCTVMCKKNLRKLYPYFGITVKRWNITVLVRQDSDNAENSFLEFLEYYFGTK